MEVKKAKINFEFDAPPSNSDAFNKGYAEGYSTAAEDYALRQVVELSGFDECRGLGDMYGMGYELGYMRKLAEILLN